MASDSATLRRLLRSGETKAVHERLRSVGMTKLGDRLRAIGTLTLEAGAEEDIVPVALPSARGLTAMLPRPRVAFVCHTGYFSGGFGGATRASLSMIREARRICGSADGGGGLDVIALVQKPVPEALVFKLEDGRLGELDWEGERVLVGRDDVLAGVGCRLRTAADRSCRSEARYYRRLRHDCPLVRIARHSQLLRIARRRDRQSPSHPLRAAATGARRSGAPTRRPRRCNAALRTQDVAAHPRWCHCH